MVENTYPRCSNLKNSMPDCDNSVKRKFITNVLLTAEDGATPLK
jgi:hypothetical protein